MFGRTRTRARSDKIRHSYSCTGPGATLRLRHIVRKDHLMRKSIPLLVAGALMLSAGAAQAKTDPEVQLAKITDGRTAGAPVDCIYQRDINSTQIIGRTAIVYKMNNGTIYVNRPDSGANFLDRDDILVTNTHSN